MNTKNMIQGLIRFRDEECGASAIEYGLFASLIAAVIAVTVGNLGLSLNTRLGAVDTSISTPPTAPQ